MRISKHSRRPFRVPARIVRSLLLSAPLVVTASRVTAQGGIAGWIFDKNTHEPLSDARVTLLGTSVVSCSGLSGYYSITNIAANTVQVRVLRIPYAPEMRETVVQDGTTARLDFEISGATMSVDGQARGNAVSGDAAHRIVAALFATMAPAPNVIADAERIVAKTLTSQRAADSKSPDYLGTLNDLAEKRNSEIATLLPSDSMRAAFYSNVKRHPEGGCRQPSSSRPGNDH